MLASFLMVFCSWISSFATSLQAVKLLLLKLCPPSDECIATGVAKNDVQMFIIISVLGAKDLEKGGHNISLQLIFLLFVQKLCIERLNLWTIWDKTLPYNALFVAVLSFSLLAKKTAYKGLPVWQKLFWTNNMSMSLHITIFCSVEEKIFNF